MDQDRLDEMIDELVVKNQHEKAEAILLREFEVAKTGGNKERLDAILRQLVFVYSSSDPPNVIQGKRFCTEREQNIGSAYNMLQTAMFEYFTAQDYEGAASKLRQAIRKGEEEDDSRTVYSSLGMLGRALLELGQNREAASVLNKIERMITDKKPLVVGDETAFLESAYGQGFERESVRRVAAALTALCSDPEFKRRLSVLAAR